MQKVKHAIASKEYNTVVCLESSTVLCPPKLSHTVNLLDHHTYVTDMMITDKNNTQSIQLTLLYDV